MCLRAPPRPAPWPGPAVQRNVDSQILKASLSAGVSGGVSAFVQFATYSLVIYFGGYEIKNGWCVGVWAREGCLERLRGRACPQRPWGIWRPGWRGFEGIRLTECFCAWRVDSKCPTASEGRLRPAAETPKCMAHAAVPHLCYFASCIDYQLIPVRHAAHRPMQIWAQKAGSCHAHWVLPSSLMVAVLRGVQGDV